MAKARDASTFRQKDFDALPRDSWLHLLEEEGVRSAEVDAHPTQEGAVYTLWPKHRRAEAITKAWLQNRLFCWACKPSTPATYRILSQSQSFCPNCKSYQSEMWVTPVQKMDGIWRWQERPQQDRIRAHYYPFCADRALCGVTLNSKLATGLGQHHAPCQRCQRILTKWEAENG